MKDAIIGFGDNGGGGDRYSISASHFCGSEQTGDNLFLIYLSGGHTMKVNVRDFKQFVERLKVWLEKGGRS